MAFDSSKAKPTRLGPDVVSRPTSLPRRNGPLNLPPNSSTSVPKVLVRVRQPAVQAKGKKAGQVAKAAAPITIFQDDFSINNLADPGCPWTTGYPWGQTLNAELQYYTRYDKNFLTDCQKGDVNHYYLPFGTLALRVKYEPGSYEIWEWPNNTFTPTCKPYRYTSAMLWSKQKFLYGHFEIRCKIPFNGTTLFPAFWLFSGDPYREIDIFEFDHPTTGNLMLTNIHIDRSLDFDRTHHDPGNSGPVNDYGAQTLLHDVSGFHVYAMQWRPNSVTWLVDGLPVRILAGHSPPLDMNLIVNVAMASWRDPPSPSHFPSGMEIDYVRVERLTDPEFLYGWGNQGDGKIAAWKLNATDRLVAGRFSGGARTQLLAVAANGWSHLMQWDGASWHYAWGNNGGNQIALWKMRPDDRYLAGDFNGDGRDDLLVMSVNGWSHMMRWDGASWHYAWDNNGSNRIALWQMRPTDRYVVGDFDGDGRDELLVVAGNGWSHMMRWDGASWQYAWGNNGGNQIGLWQMRPDDRYFAGDFDGDGREEVLVVAGSNGWSHLLRWDGSAWQFMWGNNGDNQIGLWQLRVTDRYVVGDFEGTGRSQLAVLSNHGWAHAMFWSGAAWQYMWGNDGGGTIHRWLMSPTDRFVSGAFDGGKSLVLATAANGWAHLLKYEPVP